MLALEGRLGHAMVCKRGSISMQASPTERWQQLCEQAASEKDPQKRSELVYQIHLLLREKEAREHPAAPKPKDAART